MLTDIFMNNFYKAWESKYTVMHENKRKLLKYIVKIIPFCDLQQNVLK